MNVIIIVILSDGGILKLCGIVTVQNNTEIYVTLPISADQQ
jgi:hypothetical protein